MSTRAIILITSASKTVRLWKDKDGYPTAVMSQFVMAFNATYPDLDAKSKAADEIRESLKLLGPVEKVAEFLAENWKVHLIEARFSCGFRSEHHLGESQGSEWVYVFDLSKKNLSVYGGEGKAVDPRHHIHYGVTDPLKDAQKMEYHAVKKEETAIQTAMNRISDLGFTINSPVSERKLYA